jgi:hypothetical protein
MASHMVFTIDWTAPILIDRDGQDIFRKTNGEDDFVLLVYNREPAMRHEYIKLK